MFIPFLFLVYWGSSYLFDSKNFTYKQLPQIKDVLILQATTLFPSLWAIDKLRCDTLNFNILNEAIFILITMVTQEILWYIIHRLFHTRLLYSIVHKKHHEYVNVVAFCTLYSHPLEIIFSNLLPISTSMLLFNHHIYTFYLIFTFATVLSIWDHVSDKTPHSIHHRSPNFNYSYLFMDYIFGTRKI
jgi:sterol desaturase/sphingolipid hydroxylase (fatty acid hydroxylase superfamily)